MRGKTAQYSTKGDIQSMTTIQKAQSQGKEVFALGNKNYQILTLADLRTGMIIRPSIGQTSSGKNTDYNNTFGAPMWDHFVVNGNEINTEVHAVKLQRPYAQISDVAPDTITMGYETISYSPTVDTEANTKFILISDVNDPRPTVSDTSLFQSA